MTAQVRPAVAGRFSTPVLFLGLHFAIPRLTPDIFLKYQKASLSDRLGEWGPTNIDTQADDENEVIRSISNQLVGWKLEEVNVQVRWPDGGNDARHGDRIKVDISAPYRPSMTFVLGNPAIVLLGTSTMHVAH